MNSVYHVNQPAVGTFELSDADRLFGAEVSEALGEVSGSIAIGLATCGAGKLGEAAKAGIKAYDIASGVVEVGRAGIDMANNGVTLGNAAQMAGGALGAATSASSTCFTEGTQIVVGMEFYGNSTCNCETAGVECHGDDGCGTEATWRYVTKGIEDIAVGDWVYSYDTITGEVVQRQVTDVFVRESDHINYLTIVDEDGREQVIETTDSHPFWVVTDNPDWSRAARSVVDENGVILYHENLTPGLNGYWVEAKDLREGDVFLGANGEVSTLVFAERMKRITILKYRTPDLNRDTLTGNGF